MDYMKSDSLAQKRNRRFRIVILVLVLVFSTTLGVLHQHPIGWKPAGVDAFCPFGGIESALSLVTTGRMLSRIAWSSFTLLGAVLLLAVLFRRSFCGNLCPLGTLQELFGTLGEKIFGKRYRLNSKIDETARFLKYAVLVVFVALSWILGTLAIRPYDPWAAYNHLTSVDLLAEFSIGFGILVLSLIGSMFLERVFCKYLCPMGAFLGLINRIGSFRVKRNDETCIHCKKCDKACPVNINVSTVEQVQSSECINCNECINVCPVRDTLFVGNRKRTKLGAGTVVLVSVILFTAVVAVASFTGGFEWKQKTIVETTTETGVFNPDEIRGSDTFRDVSEITGIDKKLFMNEFDLSEEEFDLPIKDSAHREGSEWETENVREFVKKQLEFE
jgi:polyferredoxin